MMSKPEKVIPWKVSLRRKSLKNNGDSSFQSYAEKFYGCHGNIHEDLSLELKCSKLKFTGKKTDQAETPNSNAF